MLGNPNTLIASFFWGTIGFGFFIYGKKQSSMIPLFGGLAMMGVSYFISSALFMTALSIALVVAMIWLIRRGY